MAEGATFFIDVHCFSTILGLFWDCFATDLGLCDAQVSCGAVAGGYTCIKTDEFAFKMMHFVAARCS